MSDADDILILVTKLRTNLQTKLQNTKKLSTLDEITSRIGSLAKPSKMPGFSWSIPASKCITGAKLAQVAGTPCSKCYALKGRYNFPNVQNALDVRLNGWETDMDWPKLMAIRILLHGEKYFRWFDSGDLQNVDMLLDINVVAQYTYPWVKHWLPTQERFMVRPFNPEFFSPNLNIRISSTKINSIQGGQQSYTNSYVTTCPKSIPDDVRLCPSSQQKGKCLDCRACWDRDLKQIAYMEH